MLSVPQSVNSSLRQNLAAENRAIYLPAISSGWARFAHAGSFEGTLPFTATDLNFLDPSSKLFHYPYALYSAGQSNTKIAPRPDMVSARDRSSTIILGDSGGYQVSKNAEYFQDRIVLDNMRWMELIADYSMVLDFPTGGIASGVMQPHIERLTNKGHDLAALNATNRLGFDYNACLLQTQLNNDEFVANRSPGATSFLNVLQGRSEKESKFWYDAVKHYPFEGWAFAGHHQDSFSLLLARLIDMRDDGHLANADWIHVLGVSVAPIGVLLTQVQRTVRKLYNPRIQFSFDTASAFLQGVNHSIYAGATFDERGWSTHTIAHSSLDRALDHRNLGELLEESLEGSETRRRVAARTAVSRNITLADMRDPATGQLSKVDGYNLLTHHNVEALIDIHEEAHHTYFEQPWMSHLTPASISWIAALIEAILPMPTDDAYAAIKEHKLKLDILRERKR